MNDQQLAAYALSTWNANPSRREDARYALFSRDGQYHGSYPSAANAHAYVDSVADTEVWIGQGYRVIRFR